MSAIALLPFLFAGAGAVSDLSAAQKAYADVEYARCRDKARAALLVPATRSERTDAWRLLGLCAAAEGDAETAREAFRTMLAIDKDARLPDGLSPRFTSSFREAKGSWVGVVPLALEVDRDEVGRDGRTVRVRVEDAAELVARLAWRGEGGALSPPVKKAPIVELDLPTGVDVTVVALDAEGGEVAVLDLSAKKADTTTAIDPTPTGPAAAAEDEGFPWVVVGGVAGAVLVVGAVGGVVAIVAAQPAQVTLKTDVVFAE
jgi:hypothetical protein